MFQPSLQATDLRSESAVFFRSVPNTFDLIVGEILMALNPVRRMIDPLSIEADDFAAAGAC